MKITFIVVDYFVSFHVFTFEDDIDDPYHIVNRYKILRLQFSWFESLIHETSEMSCMNISHCMVVILIISTILVFLVYR